MRVQDRRGGMEGGGVERKEGRKEAEVLIMTDWRPKPEHDIDTNVQVRRAERGLEGGREELGGAA